MNLLVTQVKMKLHILHRYLQQLHHKAFWHYLFDKIHKQMATSKIEQFTCGTTTSFYEFVHQLFQSDLALRFPKAQLGL